MGERTYGDAALRQAITLEDGSAIILAVAKYYSPNGKSIQDTGVTPTVSLVESEPLAETEEEAPPEPPSARPSEDKLLEKAVEVLREKIRQSAG